MLWNSNVFAVYSRAKTEYYEEKTMILFKVWKFLE
jgi:hypothetical protein